MSKNKLSVVRYRYNTAQVLAEILRRELDSSDDESDVIDGEVESDVDDDVVETAVDVADKFGVNDVGEDTSTISCAGDNGDDSDVTVDYEPSSVQFVVDVTRRRRRRRLTTTTSSLTTDHLMLTTTATLCCPGAAQLLGRVDVRRHLVIVPTTCWLMNVVCLTVSSLTSSLTRLEFLWTTRW